MSRSSVYSQHYDASGTRRLMDANPERSGYLIQNDSDVSVLLTFGTEAPTRALATLRMGPGDVISSESLSAWRGAIHFEWTASTDGLIRVTEWSNGTPNA